MDPSSLTKLCVFGADVGSRLIHLAASVDGMPTAVKSLGFEIWATCEILCELSMILARAQLNIRAPFFNPAALEEMNGYLQICDEVIYEAARGVLVAHERLQALKLIRKPSKTQASEQKEKAYLSFQERTRWPLFQQRVKTMMEALMNAKMDLTVHILVYWVVWEAESRRKSRSSIFGNMRSADRASLISQLWNSKVRREEEAAKHIPQPSLLLPSSASTVGSGTISIFALSHQSGSSSPSSDGTSPTSSSSTSGSSTDSLLRRMGSRFFKSSRRKLEAMGLAGRKESTDGLSGDEINPFEEMQKRAAMPSHRTISAKTQGSLSSDQSSTFREKPRLLRRVQSERPELNTNRHSLQSFAESAQTTMTGKSGISKSPIWSAGPTKSAKAGIAREWSTLPSDTDELVWQHGQGALGQNQNPRDLGRQLLFNQLEAQMPYWAVMDVEGVQEVGEMLVGRWIESGRVRKRMAEWDHLASRKPVEEAIEGGEIAMRFHFARR